MYQLKSEITLGDNYYEFCNSININSGWADLTDKASLIMPRKIFDVDRIIYNGENSLIKYGDPVDLKLWYGPDLKPETRFTGFISDCSPKLPIKISCEDAMFLMGRFTLTKTFKEVTLKELVDYVFSEGGKIETRLNDYTAEVNIDVNLGQFRINRGTGKQIFDEIKSKYGINTYVKNGVFVVGFRYMETETEPKKFTFEENIISDDLVYQKAEDLRIKVKAVSIDANNEKITVEVGDPEGEQRTLHYYNKDEATLKQLAEEQIDKLKYTGYRGSFLTFLHPYVEHSQVIELISKKIPERSGKYYIAKVDTSFGISGGRQKITLDKAF